MWKFHAIYESRPCSVIVTLGRQLYKIPEVAPPTAISLVSAKQYKKVISQTGKFVLFMIHPQSEWKVTTTSMSSTQGSSTQQKKLDKVMEEYRDILTSPTEVPLQCQVKHSIEITPGTPLPNKPMYWCSLLENEEIKHQIQEMIQKGHIRLTSSPYKSLIMLVKKKDETSQILLITEL